MKNCEICGDSFIETRSIQKYCPDCGKNPEKARRHYTQAEYTANVHAGVYNQQKTVICPECDREFVTYMGRRFCSDTCKANYRIHNATCTYCHANLLSQGIVITNINGGVRFCNNQCEDAYRWKLARDQGRVRLCQTCGKEYIGKNKIFCSKVCMSQSHINKTYQQTVNTTEVTCLRCKKLFMTSVRCPSDYCESCNKAVIAYRHSKALEQANQKHKQEEIKHQVDIKENGLCFYCQTTYANCEYMRSKYIYYPQGAKIENGKVVVCPDYTVKHN